MFVLFDCLLLPGLPLIFVKLFLESMTCLVSELVVQCSGLCDTASSYNILTNFFGFPEDKEYCTIRLGLMND